MTTYAEFLVLKKQVEHLEEMFEDKACQLAVIATGGDKPSHANGSYVALGAETVSIQWTKTFRGEQDDAGELIEFPASWMDRSLDEVRADAKRLLAAKAREAAEVEERRKADELSKKEAWERSTYERLRAKYEVASGDAEPA
jgi:hypothetical protein